MRTVNKFKIHNFQKRLLTLIERIIKSMSSKIFLMESIRSLSMEISMMQKKIKYPPILFNYWEKQEDYPNLSSCSPVINKNGSKEYQIAKLSNKNQKISRKKEESKKKKRKNKPRRKHFRLVKNIKNLLKKKTLKFQSYNK